MGEIRDFKSGKGGKPQRESSPRRLAAIVAGDIAGYSRLMEIDEEGTHGRVKRLERGLIEPSISGHHGKLVKTTGDGFIAIFDSPVEAVRCSIVIQQDMVGRNASLPKHHWIEYRIGVNLGDVIIESTDIYGDGVNIASRLEGIADPGQVFRRSQSQEHRRSREGLPRGSGSDCLQQDPKTAREHSDFFAEPCFADHRKRRALVFASAPLWKSGVSGISPGFARDAEGALIAAATDREASSAATSALAASIARHPASGVPNPGHGSGVACHPPSSAPNPARSFGGPSWETGSVATAARVSGHADNSVDRGGPRTRNECASRR